MDTVNAGSSVGMGLVPGGVYCPLQISLCRKSSYLIQSQSRRTISFKSHCSNSASNCRLFLKFSASFSITGSPAHPLLSLALSYPEEQGGSEKDASQEISSVRSFCLPYSKSQSCAFFKCPLLTVCEVNIYTTIPCYGTVNDTIHNVF